MMYTFGDESSPARANQKHRRSRGYLPRRKSNNSAARVRNGAASSQNVHGHLANSNSYQQGEQHCSSAADRANQPQATYYSAEGWGDVRISSSSINDETGSLNYSTSSSVQSAESSSNSSSFADILKQIDSDIDLKDYSDPEIKDLIAKQSNATNDPARLGQAQYSKMRGMGMEMSSSAPPPAAVAGWIQRREQQQQQQQKQYQYQIQPEAQQHTRKQLHQYSSHFSTGLRQQQHASPGHVNRNYARDNNDGEINGANLSEQGGNVLETIAGKRDEDNNINRPANITLNAVRPQTTQSPGNDVFRGRDPLSQQTDSHRCRSDSPASRSCAKPRVAPGHVTPPPNARGKRTSAAPPGSAGSISRTSSRHSKSSSDGSFDTPAPSSPPHSGGTHSSKPPQARSSPVSKTRRKGGDEKEDKVVEIGSYQNPWFCGFADSLNFEGAFR